MFYFVHSFLNFHQVMAGVIGIYGLLSEAIPSPLQQSRINVYSIYTAMAHLAAGLCCGISGLAAGGCIGIVGDMGIRAVGYRSSNITIFYSTTEYEHDTAAFVGVLIMLIFSEALALICMV